MISASRVISFFFFLERHTGKEVQTVKSEVGE